MAAVPGYRHDVFVSYAHSDNVRVAGAEIGFVSQLVADLRAEVGRKIGKSLDIWWDHYQLSGNTQVTPEIMAAAGDCASIVVIASPAYLRSEWCDRERSTFFQVLSRRQPGLAGRLRGLHRADRAGKAADLGLKDLTGYEFYRALEDGRTTRPLRTELDSDKEPYYNRLSQLVQNVTDHLDGLLTRASTRAAGRGVRWFAAKDAAPCVLLLEVTDDLVERRAELKDYLEQSGVVVLPERRYPRDDIAFTASRCSRT